MQNQRQQEQHGKDPPGGGSSANGLHGRSVELPASAEQEESGEEGGGTQQSGVSGRLDPSPLAGLAASPQRGEAFRSETDGAGLRVEG